MEGIIVDIHLPRDEYLRIYEGSARDVVAQARDGRWVRFPASILRPFVTHDGVRGRFRIRYDALNRFRDIVRHND